MKSRRLRMLAAGVSAVSLAACGSSSVNSTTSLGDSAAFKALASGISQGAKSNGIKMSTAQVDTMTNCLISKANSIGVQNAGQLISHKTQIGAFGATCLRQALGTSTGG
jgi:hypothetical protein